MFFSLRCWISRRLSRAWVRRIGLLAVAPHIPSGLWFQVVAKCCQTLKSMYARAARRAIAIETRVVRNATVRKDRENPAKRERPIPRNASHLRTTRRGPKVCAAAAFRKICNGSVGVELRSRHQLRTTRAFSRKTSAFGCVADNLYAKSSHPLELVLLGVVIALCKTDCSRRK